MATTDEKWKRPVAAVGIGMKDKNVDTSSSKSILKTADEIIHGDRAQTYGPAEESFDRIAKLWSAYLGTKVDAYDVSMLMVLMKVSRSKHSIHMDNFVDIAGYAALALRCAEKAGR